MTSPDVTDSKGRIRCLVCPVKADGEPRYHVRRPSTMNHTMLTYIIYAGHLDDMWFVLTPAQQKLVIKAAGAIGTYVEDWAADVKADRDAAWAECGRRERVDVNRLLKPSPRVGES